MFEPNQAESNRELTDRFAVYTRHQHEKTVAESFSRNGLEVRELTSLVVHLKVELSWLPLIGFAYGILIDLLVLTGALVLTLALLSRASEVENLAAGWIVVIGDLPCREAATPARSVNCSFLAIHRPVTADCAL